MNQKRKTMDLSKALDQAMPTLALKKNIELTYENIVKTINNRVNGEDDSGQIEVIKGDWCFCIDFRVTDQKAEYWCPMLFYKGDEVKCPWSAYDFDYDCQPIIKEGYNDFIDNL